LTAGLVVPPGQVLHGSGWRCHYPTLTLQVTNRGWHHGLPRGPSSGCRTDADRSGDAIGAAATARRASARRASARRRQNDGEASIIGFLANHPKSTVGDLARSLNLDSQQVAACLTQLAGAGEVRKAAHGYNTLPSDRPRAVGVTSNLWP
jgi:hypothetical protein